MSQLISSFSGDLATTPEGRAWALKALHPADPVTDCRGLPDASVCPTTCIAYNMVARVPAPAGPASWGFDLSLIPNAICPGFIRVLDANGLVVSQYNLLNQNLTPPGVVAPTYAQLLTQFRSLGIEAHRLAYFGTTAYQDGPALADQGTICAAQWHVAPRKYAIGINVNLESQATRQMVVYQESDYAHYETSQYLPNAYFGVSKGGVYLPLRLSGNEKWRTEADLQLFNAGGTWSAASGDRAVDVVDGVVPILNIPPYPSLEAARVIVPSEDLVGDSVFKPLNDIWGGISARNLSPQTNFAFYFRLAIECRVHPTSVYASQVRMSPAYDPVAIASYARISRELKDAYSSDFNDLGKLWDVIKSVARVVLPAVGLMGPVGAAISGAGQAVMGIVDKASQRGESNPPPAAAVERMKEAQMVTPMAVARVQKAVATTSNRRKKSGRRPLPK